MSPITKRFIQVIDYLILIRKVKSSRDFAIEIGTAAPTITEIRKGRTNIGYQYLSAMAIKFNINGHWLLTGEGPMLNNNHQDNDKARSLIEKIKFLERENDLLRQISKKSLKSV